MMDRAARRPGGDGGGRTARLQLAQQAGCEWTRACWWTRPCGLSAEAVWARGDIARFPDPRSGRPIRVGALGRRPSARQHVARRCWVRESHIAPVPFFWSQHYDVPINYVGHAEGWDSIEIVGDVATPQLPGCVRQSGGCNAGRVDLIPRSRELAHRGGRWNAATTRPSKPAQGLMRTCLTLGVAPERLRRARLVVAVRVDLAADLTPRTRAVWTFRVRCSRPHGVEHPGQIAGGIPNGSAPAPRRPRSPCRHGPGARRTSFAFRGRPLPRFGRGSFTTGRDGARRALTCACFTSADPYQVNSQ